MYILQAGLEDRQLKLCLEPVAASIWCLSIIKAIGKVEHYVGIPFMVIDLGGKPKSIKYPKQRIQNLTKTI